MATTVQVTKYGQHLITIPAPLAEAAELTKGSKVKWTVLPGKKLALEKA